MTSTRLFLQGQIPSILRLLAVSNMKASSNANSRSDSDDDLKLQHPESQQRLQASLARFTFQTPLQSQTVRVDPDPKIAYPVPQEQATSKKRQRTSYLQNFTPDPIVSALHLNQVSSSPSKKKTPANRRKPKHVRDGSSEVCRHLPKLQDYLQDNLEGLYKLYYSILTKN